VIESVDGGTRVSGPLTYVSAVEVLAAMREAWPPAGYRGEFSIDLSAAGPVDSAAVSLMLSWRRKARAEGFEVRYQGVPEALQLLADLYGVDELLALPSDVPA
jgi:phospholipid transport system transporter-binding protein